MPSFQAWTKETFFANTIRDDSDPDSCWIWKGAKAHSSGKKTPGQLRGFTSYKGKSMLASKAAWLISGRIIPHGKQLNHKCNIGLCVRPSHIYLGTHRQNLDDRRAMVYGTRRQDADYCNTERNKAIREWRYGNIQDLYNNGLNINEIGAMFSMNFTGISRIKNGLVGKVRKIYNEVK